MNIYKAIQQPASSRLFALYGHRQGGFTLIELMVVVVIISVIMTFATLSIGGDRRADELKQESKRLLVLMQLASEEAVLRSSQLGVRFGDGEYGFYFLQNGLWLPVEGDRQFRERALPKGIELTLELEDSPALELNLKDEEQLVPQVFILSSGEMTPFTLTLSAPETEQRYQINVNLIGEMELADATSL